MTDTVIVRIPIFQLHVMDSYTVVCDRGLNVFMLSTPCNGFTSPTPSQGTQHGIFQLHVMDSPFSLSILPPGFSLDFQLHVMDSSLKFEDMVEELRLCTFNSM